jgi:putative tricarboxylic transport membrane protein
MESRGMEERQMNYPAASYGVSKASVRNRSFAVSCGELTRMSLKKEAGQMEREDGQLERNCRKMKSPLVMLCCVALYSLLLLAATDVMAADPSADNYPSKPIEYVVHSSAGGINDLMARMIGDIFQKEKTLSKPVVTVNKPGAGGGMAMGYVFAKKGDPHVILNIPTTTFIGVTLTEKLPYNIKSFTPIVNMAAQGSVMVVKKDSPFKTAQDLITEAKKRPKQLIQGGYSFTAHQSLMGRVMQKQMRVQWNFISFKNQAEALLNVLSGNVHFAFVSPMHVEDHVRAGKLAVILNCSNERDPRFKDIPTVKEAGMGEPVMAYRGILGPPNMPDYAVKKLTVAFKTLLNNDRYQKFSEDMEPAWMTSVEYGKLLAKEHDQLEELLGELKLLKK